MQGFFVIIRSVENIIPQIIANSIIAGSLYVLLALGFNLIFASAKFFELGYGAMTAIGGYAVFYLTNTLGFGLLVSIFLGVLFAGLIGFFIEKIVYKKLRKQKASSLVLLIASLGVLTVLQALIAMKFTSQFQSIQSDISYPIQIGGAVITNIQFWIIASGIILVVAISLFLKYSLFGKAVKAVSDDEEVSKIVGINTEKVIGVVFFVSSSIAGLAGILTGLDVGIEPTMGFGLLLKAIIASIIGGLGSIWGGFLGAYLLGFVENFGILQIGAEWKDAIAFMLLILFLLFRPEGIIKK